MLLSVNLGYAQFTSVPDPNFESFLEANGMGDGIPNNGLVLTANIENVTDLILPPGGGISDMTGIEDFLSLEFLVLNSNPISTIDLSQNTALTTLGCRDGQLTSLDLSNNTQLEWLSCQGNQLTSLLLNSQNLMILECFDNSISNLDLSQASGLVMLNCQQNALSTLDISQNINLEELICSNNGISALDVSNNLSLSFLNCANTGIKNLDLSTNVNLIGLLGSSIEELSFLDLRNGNNANMNVDVRGTDDLRCILVDDASASYLDNWFIDPFTTFVNNQEECDALGITDYRRQNLFLYPNPTSEFILVSTETTGEFSIVTIQGKEIKSGILSSNLNRISVSDLPDGLYFIKIFMGNKIASEKLIKF